MMAEKLLILIDNATKDAIIQTVSVSKFLSEFHKKFVKDYIDNYIPVAVKIMASLNLRFFNEPLLISYLSQTNVLADYQDGYDKIFPYFPNEKPDEFMYRPPEKPIPFGNFKFTTIYEKG
ncbi:unnamed protein product [marine sediment metagenome]|uniref:Uncharacterized protein n=1 Tax=marine sediment metagenome TaxID=412755 RepID=X1T373_9ZZZZ